ncbi:MAG: hypothetical protein Q4C89_14450 [Deinococcus sp.]|uniref:hypothetical protein n=1 Tax=Deinococcus sp. TaxID=47478 RepID=UPI0026DC01CB|nr:hypothetical protein [Deinococcus sp.]MDO4247216.1 hypothetical protein [Deinococcus sp.]
MKNIFLLLLTAGLLASCAPKTESTTTTSTDGATTTTTTTETTTTETTTEPDSTLANDDQANVSEEVDMAAGDGLEGTVMNFDGTARTFELNENDKNYKINLSDTTEFAGIATTADEFFGADRNGANIAVEGAINGDTIDATKVTTSQ